MSFLKLVFKPGINRDQTNYSGEGGWSDGDKIRFFSGFPQKLGGWQKATPNPFIGVCRQVWNWVTSFTDNFLGVGTDIKLYIEVGGEFYDITPLRATLATPATDDCIETTIGLTTITVNVTAHGCLSGDYVTISGVTGDVGGVPDAEINAEHVITRVDDDIFTFTVATPADTTVATGGGSSIDIECQIHPGYPLTTAGYGWGAGLYDGDFGWGLSGDTPIDLLQRDWFMDNFDNDLVANIRRGPIYYWERGSSTAPSTALDTRAILLSDLVDANSVPTLAMQVAVSQNDKHLLAFGCQPYAGGSTDFDPLLIRWASQDEPEYWNPTGTTPGGAASSAGFLRVSRGSEIVAALATRQETLVWTDTTLYSFNLPARRMCLRCNNSLTTSPLLAHGQQQLPTTPHTGWARINSMSTPVKFKHCQQPSENTFTKILITLRPIKSSLVPTKALMRSGGSTLVPTPTGTIGM
jgi:signal peptidase I